MPNLLDIFSGRGGFSFSKSLDGDAVTWGPWPLDATLMGDRQGILMFFAIKMITVVSLDQKM